MAGLYRPLMLLITHFAITAPLVWAEPVEGPKFDFKQKIVHLDLKGSPLSISYMEEIFPLLRKMGATGLLVEYEDMFPYSGPLANLSASNHYSTDDIKRLLSAASRYNLTVMPLVQTFGHLEFSLKLEEHIELREVALNPQVLCPSYNKSLAMVREMIRQVADLHQGHITRFHIGSDEVWVIGECSRCQKRMAANKWTTDDLFLDHVQTVTTIVKEHRLQPVMWDDMFRGIDENKLAKFNGLTSGIEIMVWQYAPSVPPAISAALEKYTRFQFRSIWVASAFKGGVNPQNQMPAYEHHLNNHIAWASVAKQYESRLNFTGIVITGWQRFDHFAPLCELFPSSVPLLALCLAYLTTGSYDDKVLAGIQKQLKCNEPIPLKKETLTVLECSYPGAEVYVAVQMFSLFQKSRQDMEAGSQYKAAFSPMNTRHNFSSPGSVAAGLPYIVAMQLALFEIKSKIQSLANVADNATLSEWMETYLNPEIGWLDWLSHTTAELLSQRSWPRRPLYGAPDRYL